MVSLFVPVRFKTQVQLKPSELDHRFEDHIVYKLQTQYEGLCSRYGYIKPGSIKIVERSLGQLIKSHFNGHIRFDVSVVADVCNPVEGTVISAVVKNKNQMGILAESAIRIENVLTPVLDIIIPKRTAGISSEIPLDGLAIGDVIQVEILGKRYQLNDKKISIIGRGVETEQSAHQRRQQENALLVATETEMEGDDAWQDDDIGHTDGDESDSIKHEDSEGEGEGDADGDDVRPAVIEEVDKSPFDADESDLDYENDDDDFASEEEEYCGGSDDDE